jgi:transcription initiation factor TFIID subunit 13
MFGFGDDANPLPQSIALMEDLVVDYLQRVLHSAADTCEERSRHARRGGEAPRVKERDLLFALRKDKRRLRRAQELLEVYEEQKEARKDYAKDQDEYAREEL